MNQCILLEYHKKKGKIKKRLKEFRSLWNKPDRKVFSELCFCICTPQSKAIYCNKAVSYLENTGVLFSGNANQIRFGLKAVRFPNNKSRFIVEARRLFKKNGSIKIKDKINTENINETRIWLAKNVKGIGLKEASHFLRNIGFGANLAILDVHILKNMKGYGVIKEIPKNMSPKKYFLLEDKLRRFSKKINIPLDELDLLFWSFETGEVFK